MQRQDFWLCDASQLWYFFLVKKPKTSLSTKTILTVNKAVNQISRQHPEQGLQARNYARIDYVRKTKLKFLLKF